MFAFDVTTAASHHLKKSLAARLDLTPHRLDLKDRCGTEGSTLDVVPPRRMTAILVTAVVVDDSNTASARIASCSVNAPAEPLP